jgi:hypothetical protein
MPILFLTDDDKSTIIQNKVSTLAYPTITIPKHEPSSVIPSSSFVRVVGQTSTKETVREPVRLCWRCLPWPLRLPVLTFLLRYVFVPDWCLVFSVSKERSNDKEISTHGNGTVAHLQLTSFSACFSSFICFSKARTVWRRWRSCVLFSQDLRSDLGCWVRTVGVFWSFHDLPVRSDSGERVSDFSPCQPR